MNEPAKRGLDAWHAIVRHPTEAALDALLADEVVFHSPIVHTPQRGRALARLYLLAAFQVLASDGPAGDGAAGAPPRRRFRYVREVVGERDAVLEFESEIDGLAINGVDMICWDEAGRIVDFKVMIRPLKAIQAIHAAMGRMLEAMKRD
ncbi:MAG: nuclear transport factor 2 family protein [Myxococcota bacterium]